MSCALTVKEGPRLKSKCKKRVQAAIEYMKMIDDFDDLVDPRTLAHHFLGLEPSSFILRAIEIEEKSDFFFTPSLLFFFFLFFWRRNDDQVQSGDVCQDEGQEEQVPFEPR